MKWFFKDVDISRKFATVFIILLFMIGFGGAVGLYNASQIFKVTERLYIDSFKRLESLSGLEAELLSARQEIFLYAMVRDPSTRSFLEIRVFERRKSMESLLHDYNQMELTAEDKALYELMLKDLDDFWHVHIGVLTLSQSGDRDNAISVIQMEGNRTFTKAMNTLKTLVGMSRGGALSSYERSGFFSRIIIAVTVAFTLSSLALAVGLWLALKRSIVAPILAIEKSARSIASGDFTGRVPVMNNDEIGSLAVEFNYMTKSLQDYYTTLESRVRERTEELRAANEELQGKQKELELANMGLSEANKMKNQFLANVSHELRTPLNSILGFSELLSEKAFGEINDKQAQYVDYIHSSGEQLLRLINNIIDLSKIDVDKMELMPEYFTITEALGEVLGIIRPLAHERSITIETKTVPASPKIRADKAKFKKVMLNVLSNAVKFNKDGGQVYIDWQMREETSGRDFRHFVVFSVRDTGIGIKDADKDTLFTTFKQADSSFNREYDGSGLGLVLTKRLIELHGGSIWFESEEGRGSTFYLKFPQGTDDIKLPDFTDYLNIEHQKPERPLVLMAVESSDINHLIKVYMEGGHYDTLTVSDGLELLNMAIEKQPFAIIMGISLPGKDGWEVLKELKANKETEHIPVIIVSSSENTALSLDLGAMAHIGKSLDKVRLLTTLNSISEVQSRVKHDRDRDMPY
ncbi:MAG: ATP-binding protein [Thermodesulfobacteriota bacterium]